MKRSRFALLLLVPSLAVPHSPARASAAEKASAARMVVPFIQDDYAKALAEGRARKVPIFIEAWAPW